MALCSQIAVFPVCFLRSALVYADPNCVLGSKALFAQQMGAIGVIMYMCTPGAPCTNVEN